MKVRAIRQHRSTHGFHLPGDEYEERKDDAEMKARKGIVEIVGKDAGGAPENKAAEAPEAKSRKSKNQDED